MEAVLKMVVVTEGEGVLVEGTGDEPVLEMPGVTEEEIRGVGDGVEVVELCTAATSVTFSTACLGELSSLPAKNLAVDDFFDKHSPELYGIPFVGVQSAL